MEHFPKDQPEPDPVASEGSLILDLFGTLVTFQVRSAETNGAYAILEMALPADDAPLRMHVHPAAETFQILEGELEFHIRRDGQAVSFRATAADMVHVPPDVPHGFRNMSKSPATCQIVIAPGSMEGYFLELGTPTANVRPQAARTEPQELQRLLEVGRKYGVELVDPE
jgi:mannose-6-phosphate isomerase-like protein (cupin superfamily)